MKDKLFKKYRAYIAYIAFGLFLIALPFLQSAGILITSSTIIVLGSVLFYAVAGIGLNVLLGYSGLVSLGTAGFMGMGAYLSAYFTSDLGLNFFLSIFLSVLIPLLIGLVIGLISLRIEGFYLAIATLGISEILKQVFIELEFVTGGFSGKKAGYPVLADGFLHLDRGQTFILLSIVLVLVMIFTHNFINSRTGRALLTMRASESAAKAMGINILKHKLTAFGIATAYAALAGALYVHFIRFVYPSTWTLLLSLQLLAVIVIGGVRTIFGPIIGSFIVFGVPELILKQLPVLGHIDGLAYIFNGVLIIVVVLFYPSGLIHVFYDLKRLFGGSKKDKGAIKSRSV